MIDFEIEHIKKEVNSLFDFLTREFFLGEVTMSPKISSVKGIICLKFSKYQNPPKRMKKKKKKNQKQKDNVLTSSSPSSKEQRIQSWIQYFPTNSRSCLSHYWNKK